VIPGDVKDRSLRRALRIGRAPRQGRQSSNIIEQARRDFLAIDFVGRGSRGLTRTPPCGFLPSGLSCVALRREEAPKKARTFCDWIGHEAAG